MVQVMSLQAELTYVQATLATMQRLPISQSLHSSSDQLGTNADLQSATNMSMHFDPHQQLSTSLDLSSFFNQSDQQLEDDELQALAREFVSRYLPGVRFQPSNSH
jgi:hypothetical protein